jgi:hypothetical protein
MSGAQSAAEHGRADLGGEAIQVEPGLLVDRRSVSTT